MKTAEGIELMCGTQATSSKSTFRTLCWKLIWVSRISQNKGYFSLNFVPSYGLKNWT